MNRDPATKALPEWERKKQALNEWIAWLEEWVASPPGYKTDGPMETTRGIRNLTNFLRGLAYDWPAK